MSVDAGLLAWVVEALEPIGRVTKRPIMGVAALYLDGTIFAILGEELWFKADGESDAEWDAAGCARFTFEADGRTMSINYRLAPADVHDDPEAMQHWATVALGAGLRGAAKKPKRPRTPPTRLS